jgi:hypothetical protein
MITNDNILNREFKSDSTMDLVYVYITTLPFILFFGGMIFLALFVSFGILGKILLVAGNAELYEASGHVDLLYEDFMWDLSMYSSGLIGGNDVGPYIKSQLEVDFTMFIWIIDHD